MSKKVKILFVALFLLNNFLFSQTVDFTFTTSNNLFCNPQSVTFTQNCTGSPDGFIWNFGNGKIGSNATEVINYLNPGTYIVSLTATFSSSAITVTKTIIINATPTISVSVDRNYLCQPGNITFTAVGSSNVTGYEWNFGDGTPPLTTFSNTTTHNYTTYNNFSASVKGITASGCNATANIDVQVTKFPIVASISPNNGCIPSLSTLNANVTLPTGDVASSFVWTFGDGSPNVTTSANNTPHLYNTTNSLSTASVAITTTQGCTNLYNFPTFAFGTPPFNTNAFATALRDTFCGSETIQFKATSINANLYVWDFGDGNIENTSDTFITHKYTTLGNKEIIISPYFNGCLGQKDTINIFIQGSIVFYTFSNNCSNKNTFNFLNTSLGNITKYRWTFSDAPAFVDSVNYSTVHTFPNSGAFDTKLYVYDGTTGCSDSLTTTQYTASPTLTYDKPQVCRDSMIRYEVLNTYSSNSGFIYEFFVNGNIVNNSTNPILFYNPTSFGTFNDYVVIKDPSNNTCNDTIRLNTTTKVQGPFLNFTTPLQQCQINTFPINNLSYPFFAADSITSWQWFFGDNTKDSVRFPQPHKYVSAGNYTITLKVKDINNCADTLDLNITVYPMPKIKVLPNVDTLCLGQTTTLLAFTTDTLLWTPNTNIVCNTCDTTIANPNFTTQYIAQAKNSDGCISYDTSLIKVYRPFNVNITPVDTFVCPQQLVSLNTDVVGVTTWSPNTYLSSTTIPNPVSRPDTSILYTAIVADSVGCFSDTATVKINTFSRAVINAGPDLVIPYNNNFNINPTYSANIVSYSWSPLTNNLSCANCANPSGVANFTQLYKIEGTTNNGCKATDSITVFVACDKSNLYIPTAFTPNGDGKNDYFYPLTRGYKIINKFIVFNRWGQKVFERNNFNPNVASLGWTGFNGINQPIEPETFVWFIEATCDLGEKLNTKGTVVLIR